MRVLGLRMMAFGAAALAAAPGGCTRQPQPPAQPSAAPPVVHECPKPVPTAVVYHQAQGRWEVVLAPPSLSGDAAPAELPQTLPLRTYTQDGVVEGFVPNFESFHLDYENSRITGPFPASVEFKQGQWVVHDRTWTITEQPLADNGFYGAHIGRGSSQTRYTATLTGQQIPID